MGKIFYISDLHIGHTNVIKFDGRPFSDIQEMEDTIVKNWNETVTNDDTVYILGDFCWLKENDWIRVLKLLNGSKVLIRGNHDLKEMSATLRRCFQDVKDYKEIVDNGRKVILCHYPIPFYKSDYADYVYMLYGHLHITLEEALMQEFKQIIRERDSRGKSANKCHFYNCWLGYYGYKPVTLDEIIQRWEGTDNA